MPGNSLDNLNYLEADDSDNPNKPDHNRLSRPLFRTIVPSLLTPDNPSNRKHSKGSSRLSYYNRDNHPINPDEPNQKNHEILALELSPNITNTTNNSNDPSHSSQHKRSMAARSASYHEQYKQMKHNITSFDNPSHPSNPNAASVSSSSYHEQYKQMKNNVSNPNNRNNPNNSNTRSTIEILRERARVKSRLNTKGRDSVIPHPASSTSLPSSRGSSSLSLYAPNNPQATNRNGSAHQVSTRGSSPLAISEQEGSDSLITKLTTGGRFKVPGHDKQTFKPIYISVWLSADHARLQFVFSLSFSLHSLHALPLESYLRYSIKTTQHKHD